MDLLWPKLIGGSGAPNGTRGDSLLRAPGSILAVTAPSNSSRADEDVLADDTSYALVQALRRSDAAAITRVYMEHHVAVRAFAQRLVGDSQAAEDLLQDVFVALPGAMARFRGDCALRTFLISIAVNHSRNYIRSSARRRQAMSRFKLEPASPSTEPELQIGNKQLADRLMRALDELPDEQRVVVVLSEIEERTSVEIAAIVGAPEGTVRTRLFHAKRKLRELMGGAP